MARPIIDDIVRQNVEKLGNTLDGYNFEDYSGSVITEKEKITLMPGSYNGNSLIGDIKSVFNNWHLDKSDSYWISINGNNVYTYPQVIRIMKSLIYCQLHENMRVSMAVTRVFMILAQSLVKSGKIVIPEMSVLGQLSSKTEEIVIKELFDWIIFICEGNGIEIEKPEVVSVKAKSVRKKASTNGEAIEDKQSKNSKKKSAAEALLTKSS